jgi:hypothetical protein
MNRIKKLIHNRDFQLVTLFVLIDLIITDFGILLGYGKEGNILASLFTNNIGMMLLEVVICILVLIFLFTILKGLLKRIYASFQLGASMVGISSWVTQILIVIPDNFGSKLATIFMIWSSIGIITALTAFIYFEKSKI